MVKPNKYLKSTINKLNISGIRSFGHWPPEIIKFEGPLTLIVGSNGSGKTTIIECLKYATTGKQPPNSGDGAFIHDPELDSEKKIMAQVKLGFKDANGQSHTVVRTMECTVKKNGKHSVKSLEQGLTLNRNGERIALSTRVGDLDKILVQTLGVSEAVLDNVIFCHQDESLWPLATASDLKKKFDLIFDALKYTQAVDNLRSMKKEKAAKLKQLEIHEANNKSNKTKGQKLKQKTIALQDEIEDLKILARELEVESRAALQLKNEKLQEMQKALGYKNELDSNKDKVAFIQGQVNDLRDRLQDDEFGDDVSDGWLASTLAQYNEQMQGFRSQEARFIADDQELSRKLSTSRQELSEKQSQRGQFLAEKATYEEKLRLRAKLVKDAATRHEIRGYDGDLEENEIDEFVSKLRKLSREKDRELGRVKKSIEDELHQTRGAIEVLNNSRTLLTQEKVNANQTITNNEKQSGVIQRDIDKVKVDEGNRAACEASLKDVQDRLQQENEQFEAAQYDQSMRSEQTRLRELDGEDERLRMELAQSTKLAADRAQLDHVRNDLKKVQSSLKTMESTYGSQLTSIIGPGWKVDTLEREYQAAAEQRSRALEDATKQQDVAIRDLSKVDFELKSLRKSLAEKIDTQKRYEAAVIQSVAFNDEYITSVDEYEEKLKDTEEDRDEVRKAIDASAHFDDYLKKCLADVKNKNKCRLCEREFADRKEQSSSEAKLDKLITRNLVTALAVQMQECEARYNKASAARPQFDRLKTLTDVEIPSVEKEIEQIDRKRTALLRAVEQRDSLVKEETSSKRDVDGLSKNVSKIVEYHNQIHEREAEINRISSQQKLSGTSLTSEELNEQLAACAEQIRTQRSKIDKISGEKSNKKTAIGLLEVEESHASRKLNMAQNELEKKDGLLRQLEMLRKSTVQQRETLQKADVELQALGPQLTAAKAKDAEARERGQNKERQIQTDKDRLADTVNKFTNVENDIHSYNENRGPQKLEACKRAIQDIQDSQAQIEAELVTTRARIDELKDVVTDQQKMKRRIEDNISFRKNLRQLEGYRKAVAELEERDVSGDFDRLSREAGKAEKNYRFIVERMGPKWATIESKDEILQQYSIEWETDYADASLQYRKSHIEVETTKAAISDIDKYRVALDQAIMKYHSLKMEEVNRIAGELWQTTYQGSDVDTILIRSENDTADANAARRNYNYRVCMVKDHVEMDMRGRCSAGQKVLASIVIRLALAEVFGVGCGVIALDEPTTNLDQDTIHSLADSLHHIIKARKGQSNFQLIVITHDEGFLKAMKCQEFTDIYYRVSRNQFQKSIIEGMQAVQTSLIIHSLYPQPVSKAIEKALENKQLAIY